MSAANIILRKHLEAKMHAENAVEAARECGRLLALQRERCKNGSKPFTRWVEENLPFSWRTAYSYIQVYEKMVDKPDHDYTSLRQVLGQSPNRGKKVDRMRTILMTVASGLLTSKSKEKSIRGLIEALEDEDPKSPEGKRWLRLLQLTPVIQK